MVCGELSATCSAGLTADYSTAGLIVYVSGPGPFATAHLILLRVR